MNFRSIASALIIGTNFLVAAPAGAGSPHLDLDLSGIEYQSIFHERPFLLESHEMSSSSRQLQPVLDAGKRNLDWLQYLNAHRPADRALSLSSPDTQVGSPITAPRSFNVVTVLDSFSKLRTQLPATLAAIVLDGAPFMDSPGISDQDYIQAALQVDRVYQLAARWVLLEPYLGSLAGRKKADLRAYYSLISDTDLASKLSGFETLPSIDQQRILKQLFELCFNNPTLNETACRGELSSAQIRRDLGGFYQRHLPAAERLYQSFFKIPMSRSDVTWTSTAPSFMSVPFADPGNLRILDFLRTNIEDEWKWNGWQLKLDFRPNWFWGMTRIVFEPGSTPHVDGIAGSTITMDANAPLTEYNVQWTIRHEYGHVLGFPDCYLEFWDKDTSMIVSYQLDITNLMCSRRGHLQQKHFDELKRVYFR